MQTHTFEINMPNFIKQNTSEFLAGAAIASAVGAVIFAVRAGYKAGKKVEKAEETKKEPLTFAEKAKLTWTDFIPTSVSLGVNAGTTIFMLKNERRKAAALAALYQASEAAFEKYRNSAKAENKVTAKKDAEYLTEARREGALKDANIERVNSMYDQEAGLYPVIDSFSYRVFQSNEDKIALAAEKVRSQLAREGLAYLGDFYEYLELDAPDVSYSFGWDASVHEFTYSLSPTVTDGGVPCFLLMYEPHYGRR